MNGNLLQKADHGFAPVNNVADQENRLDERAQWAGEVRKADERLNQMSQVLAVLQQRLEQEQSYGKTLVEKIRVRDEEILRLHDMYMPAQNLEKLNVKHVYEESGRTIKKLEGQVDFLNKENEKLQKQVDMLKVDETGSIALAQVDGLRKELDEQIDRTEKEKREHEKTQMAYRETLINLEELEL